MKDTLTHRQLQSLIHVSNVINSSLDIDTIIDSIMIETISAVDAAGGGSLWLYDTNQNCLIAQSAQGLFYPQIFRQIRLKAGESMTGMTFAARKGLIFPNEGEIKKALTTLSAHNYDLLRSSIPNNFHFTSVICSPILLKGDCIGVITLDSFQLSLHFKQEDINLLEAICHQAAIALEKSSLYQEKERTVYKLSHSIEIHRNLANLVLQGEGLHSIITYIHQTIGQHTLLFDDLGELIASAYDSSLSNDILNFIKQQAKHIIGSLENSRSVAEIEIDGKHYQLVVLSLGPKPKSLGILIILSTKQMSELDISALEHACTVISLELVKEQAIFDTQQRLKGELVTKLFSGQMDETIIQKAKNLNFDPTRNYIALIINFDNISNKPKNLEDSMMRNIIQMSNQVFFEKHLQGIAVRNDNQIVVLLSFHSKVSSSTIISRTKELAKWFQQEIDVKNDKTDVAIGIGRVKKGLLHVHRSLQEAAQCLKFIQNYHFDNKVISYTDLGVQRFILQNSEEELIDFIHEVLGPLIEYEQLRKGELLTTLFVYLEQNQNAKKTSDALHVHTNTLNYRLKRIEEILLINLTDSKQLFNIHLAISIYQYIKNKVN
ncbi:helix-turn-helix domain-containing protein [Priestia abyssalis]|uniref:helix-turn-helix domain-containing protein n=1 Tax=Priestia abyssalis TaxID=1221450 RepID=UPI00147395A2|nr:helix-turn-helix domain-containing protein [Priestia abyssalis]